MFASFVAVVGITATGAELSVSGTVPWSDGQGWTPVLMEVSCLTEAQTSMQLSVGNATTEWPLHLRPGMREQRWILIPTSGARWMHGVQARWTNPNGQEGNTYFAPTLDNDHALALVRPAGGSGIAGGGVLSLLEQIRDGRSSSSGSGPFRPTELDPANLPDQWQAYPAWLVLVFLPGSEAGLSGAQRQALLRWIGQGGTVVMDPAHHAAWTANARKPLALPMSGALAASADDARWPALQTALTERRRSYQTGFEADAPENRVPDTDGGGSGLAIVAVLMTIVLAAVPLLWARKRKQPLFLLVAIPVTSVAACTLLLGWDMLRFGLGATRTAVQLTLIDAQVAEHTTWSEQTRFGAWAVGNLSLAAGERWLFTERNDDWRGINPTRTNHIDGHAISGDLVRGRENAHLACTTVLPDRRRVAVRREGSQWMIANGLGVEIRSFDWIAPDGRHLCAERILADGVTALGTSAVGMGFHALPRLPVLGNATWQQLAGQPGTWRAELAAPLSPLPGLTATDAVPPTVFACGVLAGTTP
jgi:hypothetical protein